MPSRGRPPHHWKTTTFTGALRTTGLTAPFVHDGAMNGLVFQTYVSQVLVPTCGRATSSSSITCQPIGCLVPAVLSSRPEPP